MEPAVEVHPEAVGERPAAPDATAPEAETAGPIERMRPDWFHRQHPVFFPLAGFFSGMLYIIVVPGLYAAVLKGLVGYQKAESLFPFVVLTLVVPLGLLVPQHTRRFGRYMLLGVVATALVVIGVAAAVLWFLFHRDG